MKPKDKYLLSLFFISSLAVLHHITECQAAERVRVPLCNSFNYTDFPNVFAHRTQDEAIRHMHTFAPLLTTFCSDHLLVFLCLTHLPGHNSQRSILATPPCRSLCEEVRTSCAYAMDQLKFKWPDAISCDKFPTNGSKCYTGDVESSGKEVSNGSCAETKRIALCTTIKSSINTKQPFFAAVKSPFTNYFKHKSQDQAIYELSKFTPLVNQFTALQRDSSVQRQVSSCLNQLLFLLCAVHLPRCGDASYPISRTDCEDTLNLNRTACNAPISSLRAEGYVVTWPPIAINCDLFPKTIPKSDDNVPSFEQNDLAGLASPPPALSVAKTGADLLQIKWKQLPTRFNFGSAVETEFIYKLAGSRTTYQQVNAPEGALNASLRNLTKDSTYDIFVGSVNDRLLPGGLRRLQLKTADDTGKATPPFCSEFYSLTAFPNVFGHRNETEAVYHMRTLSPLLETTCSADLKAFVCAAFLPRYNLSSKSIQKPCESLCRDVVVKCSYAVQKLKFKWPPELECGRFAKHTSPCYKPSQPRARAPASGCVKTEEQSFCSLVTTSSEGQPYFQEVDKNFKNYFNHTSQKQAVYELSKHAKLLSLLSSVVGNSNADCIHNLTFFLCSLHLPKCNRKVQLTRNECTRIVNVNGVCRTSIVNARELLYSFNWPPVDVNCDSFPATDVVRFYKFGNSTFANTIPPPPLVLFRTESPNNVTFEWETYPFPRSFENGFEFLYKPVDFEAPYSHTHATKGSRSVFIKNIGKSGKDYEVFVGTLNSKTGMPGHLQRIKYVSGASVSKMPSTLTRFCSSSQHIILPNSFGDKTVGNAIVRMFQFFPLAFSLCAQEINRLMCAVHLPRYDSATNSRQMLCRSACERVYRSCSYAVQRLKFFWPSEVMCAKFDNTAPCYDSALSVPQAVAPIPIDRRPAREVTNQCKAVPSNLICSAVLRPPVGETRVQNRYFSTTFSSARSNYFQHSSTEEAIFELSRHLPLLASLWEAQDTIVARECAQRLTVLLCHLHTPLCPLNTRTVTQDDCRAALNPSSSCFKVVAGLDFPWPPVQVNCSDSRWFSNSSERDSYRIQRNVAYTPAPPTNIKVTSRTSYNITISFQPRSVPDAPPLTTAVLYKQHDAVEPYLVQQTRKPFDVLQKLDPGKEYEINVAALHGQSGLPGVFYTVRSRTFDDNVYGIPPSISMCSDLYRYTTLPNVFGDKSIDDAKGRMVQFFPLRYTLCSAELPRLMCAALLPRYDTKTHSHRPLCRAACERVYSSCSYAIQRSKFFWPDELKCDKFYNEASCYNITLESGTSPSSIPPTPLQPEGSGSGRLVRRAVTPQCKPVEPNLICSSVSLVSKNSPRYFVSTFSTGPLNYFNHTSLSEALYELSRYLRLISSLLGEKSNKRFEACAYNLTMLLCHVHVPICPRDSSILTRDSCQAIMSNTSDCFYAINELNKRDIFKFNWPPVEVNCLDRKWFGNLVKERVYRVQRNKDFPLPPPRNIAAYSSSSHQIGIRFMPHLLASELLFRKNGSATPYRVQRASPRRSIAVLDDLSPATDFEVKVAVLDSASRFPGVFGTITHNTYGRCPEESTGEDVTQGIFVWKAQDGRKLRFTNCSYGPVLQTNPIGSGDIDIDFPSESEGTFNGVVMPSRSCECLASSRNCKEVAWGKPVTHMCRYKVFNDSNTTQELSNLLQSLLTGQSSPLNVSKELANLTKRSEKFQSNDVLLTVLTLENLGTSKGSLNGIGPNIVTTVNNILNAARNVLTQSQRDSNSSARILLLIDKYLENIPLPKGGSVTQNEPNIAVHTQQVNASDFEGIAAASISKTLADEERENFRTYDNTTNVQPQGSQVSLTIPKSIFEKLNIDSKTQNQRISFVVYRKTPLFESLNKTLPDSDAKTVTKKNSYVIAGSIKGQKLGNLTDPVVSTYIPLDEAADESTACAFWDFARDGGLGDWSEVGCSYQGTKDGVVTCHCNHMTNFAMLMDVYIEDRNEDEHDRALSIISYIGCAVSLVGLILTIITILIFKDLRNKVPTQILLNFCIALSLTLIVFLAAAERSKTSSLSRCRAAAIALHYFVLAVFMWMAIEAFNMYLAFVKVLAKHYPRFMLKCCIAGWGLPAIVVIITAAVAIDDYGDGTFCRLQGLPFQVAFLAPVLLILVANSIAFVLIMRSLLTSRSKVAADRRVSGLTQARRGAAILIVLGLTWMFGALALKDAKLVFQYLFCIFNSIQGLLVFIFYCVLSETRKKYKKLFGGSGGKDSDTGRQRYHASTSDSRFHEVRPTNTHSDTYTGSTNLSTDSNVKKGNDVELMGFKSA